MASANAVRQHAVVLMHECHDERIIRLHGGHVVRVACALDEVLARSKVSALVPSRLTLGERPRRAMLPLQHCSQQVGQARGIADDFG
jgi:hypothetical protein